MINIVEMIKRKLKKRSDSSEQQKDQAQNLSLASALEERSSNPYLAGRKEWDDRYYNMKKAIKNWQFAFLFVAVLAAILAITNARIATQSKIKPVAVETCQGAIMGLLPVNGSVIHIDQVVRYALDQFVINAKTVVGDALAQKALLNKVYSYSADNTILYLRDFYNKNNPFMEAEKYNAQVKIIDTIPLSNNTWQITFDEIKTDPTGISIAGTSRWVATLTYKIGEVKPAFISQNPFGIYVTQLSWAQVSN